MRKHATSWLIKVILAVIVVVFILWGSEAYRAKQGSRVAVVNGETIGLDEYRNTYERLVEQYRRQFGNSLDNKLLETLDLKRQALDRLIERRLLLQKARDLDMLVTDGEIIQAIRTMSVFQEGDRFSSALYQRLLAANNMTPEMFEEGLRQDLLGEKMRNVMMAGVKVSDTEAFETYKWSEGKVAIEYVLFAPSAAEDIVLSPEDIESFFSENQASYETPPRIKVAYVVFSSTGFEPEVPVTKEEIEQYFDLNRATYDTPKKVRARHILFKVDSGASQKARDAAKAKAEKVLQEIRGGADFSALAKKYSEDPGSKSNGGDLGFFTRDRMVKPFADAAFALKKGEISEPVSTNFGWHIIKVEDIQEGKEAVLSDVENKIRQKLTQDGAKTLAYEKAESLYTATYGGQQLAEAAKASGLALVETDFFSQGESLKEIKPSTTFTNTAFGLHDDEVSEPLDIGDKYYVLQVIARQAATVPELSTVEEKVRKDLRTKKSEEMAQKNAEAFLAKVRGGASYKEEAKASGLEVKSVTPFKRFGSIPGIGFEKELSDAAFSLDTSRPFPEKAVKGKKGYYVIRFKEEVAADTEGFEKKKSEIISGLLLQKRQQVLEAWLSQMRQAGEVEVEEGFLN